MEIGIIGSGSIGSTVAKLAVDNGHTVKIANSRGPGSLVGLAEEIGAGVLPAEVADAADAEVVVVAIPFKAIGSLPADAFEGRVIADANNYYPDRDGNVPALDDDETTSAELLAKHLPGARVVKAFNTMHFKTLAEAGDTGKPLDARLAVFVAGDDPEAKQRVSGLIEEFGFGPVDAGALADGRVLQREKPVYGADLTAAEGREALG